LQRLCILPYFKIAYHYIYHRLIAGKFDLVVSHEILLEYEEIIQQKYGTVTANVFLLLLRELPNVHHVVPYYRWLLIETDPDDNKYCDCAIVGKADYIVTADKHFNLLKNNTFPKLTVVTIDEFLQRL
jgi:uncharacterized protein